MKQNYNNESLARLGHGKWKSALGHTLLIIGMVLMSLGVYAQHQMNIPPGLVMKKTWVPDDHTGHTGNILVETYVTGHSDAVHVPSDIVLVLDVSGSMDDRLYDPVETPEGGWTYNNYGSNTYYYLYEGTYYQVSRYNRNGYGYCLRFRRNYRYYYLDGSTASTQENFVEGANTTIFTGVLYEQGQTKMAALKTSVKEFVEIIAADGSQNNVNHTISIVKYASGYFNNNESSIAEGNNTMYNGYNYTQVLIDRRDPNVTPDGSSVNNATYIKNQVDALNAGGATSSDYGMSKARYILAAIPEPGENEPARNKVVVMFTDGVPTHGSEYDKEVAESTISNAYDLKHSWTNGGTTYTFNATVYSVGVFDNETTTINTYMNRVSSNYPDATGMDSGEGGTQAANKYYFKAETAGSLSEIFRAIAGQSGALSLPTNTVVQDMVSPSFHLPQGASTNITAYAPKFLRINQSGKYIFDTIIDGTNTLTVENGVVTSTDENLENKLPDGYVTIDPNNNNQIQLKGFNFTEQWCGYITDHGQNTAHGRKIVIKIPITVNEGLWGDGLLTNDPAESYIYNPETGEYYGPFNNVTADVQGDVWTEIVTTQPSTFTTTTIDGKTYYQLHNCEDLAWFISWVNGRDNYEVNSEVDPHWDANAILTADIDMSRHNWVPIGSGVGHGVGGYIGTFDGNGHVITGLKNNASKYFKMETEQHPDGVAVVFPGMFSKVGQGGVVKNVFVLDTDFRGKHHNAHFVHHGIIADTLLAGGTIFNCEAAGRITCNNDEPEKDKNLIYGGLVGLNQGTIHSCMAMAELTGYTLGGMIGENRSAFSNGFTNGVYKYLGSDDTYKVGGIAGINSGSIDNCYVRFERKNNTSLDKATFGMLVGDGNAPTNSYIPQIVTWSRPNYNSYTTEVNLNSTIPNDDVLEPDDNPTNSYTLSVNPTFYNMFVNDNMTGGTWGTFTNSQGTYNVYNNGTPLLDKLNANKGTGASWKRTTAGNYSEGAGNINGDFPVLQLPGYTCLASTDGITIDYASSLDEMLERHNNGNLNENTHISNEYTAQNTNYYKVTAHPAITGGTINLYQNDSIVTKSTVSGSKDGVSTVVYIDENISLLQDANSTIDAYTAQTLESYIPSGKERWHYVSSSLENSQFGWTYGVSGDAGHTWADDPCEIKLEQEDEDHALFPIDLISHKRFDFYCFHEPKYHWINFKRNSASHYHMDAWDSNTHITYDNETQFKKGKGYLMSIDMSTWASYNRDAQFIQNRGTLTNGAFTIPVTYTPINDLDGYKTGLEGCNLLGNPYQSYLDFDDFTTANSGLWSEGDTYGKTYAIYDPKTDNYIQYLGGSSEGALVANRFINMHQGFLIKVSNGGNAIFNNDMRTNNPGKNYPGFRGEKPAYPLINFILNDNDGNTDIAVLECNRPENDGAKKLRMGSPAGRIYFRYDNTNLAIYFRNSDKDYQTLNFAAEEDGNFTLSWNTANADFRTLTLVDNITGIKTDMLTHDHYTFEGRVDDYNTRFKIVFGEMDNNEEEPVLEHFAFFDHGNLIVNGTGHFEVVDVLGRVVYATELTDTQNTVSLPSNVRGVCMLCFTRNNETKVQKMVIQ